MKRAALLLAAFARAGILVRFPYLARSGMV